MNEWMDEWMNEYSITYVGGKDFVGVKTVIFQIPEEEKKIRKWFY